MTLGENYSSTQLIQSAFAWWDISGHLTTYWVMFRQKLVLLFQDIDMHNWIKALY